MQFWCWPPGGVATVQTVDMFRSFSASPYYEHETTRTDSRWAPCFCSFTEEALTPQTTCHRASQRYSVTKAELSEKFRPRPSLQRHCYSSSLSVCLFLFVLKWHWPSIILLLCIYCFCMFWNLLRIFIVNGNPACAFSLFLLKKCRRLQLNELMLNC